jgi:hypothetical protein
MRKLFLLFALFAALVSAQEVKRIQRVYEVKHADVKQLYEIVQGPDVNVRFNEHFRTISLFGSADAVAFAEEIIKRFDTARPSARASSRNVELICYILLAAPRGTAGEAVPADLEPAVKQLKATFGYNDFRLLDSSLIRAQEGGGVSTDGYTAPPNPETPGSQGRYELRVHRGIRIATDERGARIRLEGFSFVLKVSGMNVVFSSDIDIRDGQKVVIGKAKGDASAGAYILVLSARAVD